MISMAKRVVESNGRKRTLFIPVTDDDPVYRDELIATEMAKTKQELDAMPARKFAKPTDPNAVGELKERIAWREQMKSGRRVFGGITLGR